ncbi:MAG: PIN domain-containing protein [Verrucomicrobiota bacterium]
MILVDTSVIVAWLDRQHRDHVICRDGLVYWAGKEKLAVSSVTYAELAAGGRTQEQVDEDLLGMHRVDFDFPPAWIAGQHFMRNPVRKEKGSLVLPDYMIRAQAQHLGWKHLTNDRRRLSDFPQVDFIFPEDH